MKQGLIAALAAALALLPFGASSQAADLSALTTALAKVRATHGVNTDRDAGPELNSVKHALRDWVERQLPPAQQANAAGIAYPLDPQDLVALAASLNASLDASGLTCGRRSALHPDCGDPHGMENGRGYVDRVHIASFDNDHYLLVVTGVGILCGFDQSAYLYDQDASHHWRLLLSIEQDQYDGGYVPENFLAIDVSPSEKAWDEPAAPPLVTAVGTGPWCSSNWHMLNTRLWRATHATVKPRPILDREDELFLGGDYVAAARLGANDLLVQFEGGSVDSDVGFRTHVVHYAIGTGDRLTRIAPVALNPGDFVDEWLTAPWPEASKWLAPRADRRGLARWHAAKISSTFDGLPRQCRKDPGLWQVDLAEGSQARRVLVRWTAPYEFSLVAAGQRTFPGCDKAVALPPDMGTLFPLQGWKP